MKYTLSDFDYDLPEELIAQKPARPRDHARLLVYYRQTGEIIDDYFYNLADHLDENTTLVTNNSRVEKCRLLFEEGRKEVFVLETLNDRTVRALVRPGKKFREGESIVLEDRVSARVTHVDDEGIRTLVMEPGLDDRVYDRYRYTPFPPYIEQDESLSDEYQTIYATEQGSKAAPTAGLHFTGELLEKLGSRGIPIAEITLHVGLGTFAPVKEENIDNHHMHSEWYEIDEPTAETLSGAAHITAVGTTSVRVLESNVEENRSFKPETKETSIFIRPGYRFKASDALITNFHLPKSTLLMLVAAFMGFDEMHRVYHHAINERYRFYSFGDAMLIL